jgi:hypothetical protein
MFAGRGSAGLPRSSGRNRTKLIGPDSRRSGRLGRITAFPSWFLRIECDRCGKVQMVNEAHARWRDRSLRDIIARMRHDGCGGLAGNAELLTGIDGVSSRPVRKIVLRSD